MRTEGQTRACTPWLTPTPHKHWHTQTLTGWSHGARGRCPGEARSCCDCDAEKVPSPSTAGRPQEREEGGLRVHPHLLPEFLVSPLSGGSCPALVLVHRPDSPQVCSWFFSVIFIHVKLLSSFTYPGHISPEVTNPCRSRNRSASSTRTWNGCVMPGLPDCTLF